ncbi:hypothetical protein [Aeromicrobium sp.]|uniref:hypothetical protein n=1 Tax=Aeromicrobium sp. TaxID=1871063 RepID=UPI003C5EB938
MTVLAVGPTRGSVHVSGLLPSWTVAASVAVPVLARLPFLGRAASPDEGGFLLVGAQWSGAGHSLYGDYWVDRPPLLITIFRAASSLGGLTALRLIGCVAVALVVVGVARVAGLIGGQDAARWAAMAAAALCLSPWLGGYEVNGELLAAPVILAAIVLAIGAVRATRDRPAMLAAIAAGACAAAAMLIKQNLADAAVFSAVAFTLAWWWGHITSRRFGVIAVGGVLGALAAVLVLAGWTVLHGSSLTGVVEAMYPFRIRAGQVQASGGRQHSTARLIGLVGVVLSSGLALLILRVVGDVVTRRLRDPLWWAVVATTVFAGASVLLGGNYWHHYLVELVAPVSIAVGVIAARRGRLVQALIAYTVLAAAAGWVFSVAVPQNSDAQTVGRAISTASRPGDSIVNVWGHADLAFASGLPSPYAHLWSLPVKTLDPQLNQLDAVLAGPSAPTWFVTGPHLRSWGLDTARTAEILSGDYHRLGSACGHVIYLRDGVERPAPHLAACHAAGGLSHAGSK